MQTMILYTCRSGRTTPVQRIICVSLNRMVLASYPWQNQQQDQVLCRDIKWKRSHPYFEQTVLEDRVGVISHDRYFLDRVCTHILAYEGDGETTFFPGTWSEYLEHTKSSGVGVDKIDGPKTKKFRPLHFFWCLRGRSGSSIVHIVQSLLILFDPGRQ